MICHSIFVFNGLSLKSDNAIAVHYLVSFYMPCGSWTAVWCIVNAGMSSPHYDHVAFESSMFPLRLATQCELIFLQLRQTIPDQGIPVSERTLGQPGLNRKLKSEEWNPDRKVLGTAIGIADSMRFHGAIPEVANSRVCSACSMLYKMAMPTDQCSSSTV